MFQIVDTRDGDRVITVIEVLIPWNKLPGHLNREYVAKIEALEKAGASWVEIDLLRSSRSHLPVTWHDLPEARRAQYLVITYNGNDGDLLGYPISIRQALPKISIPLREGDPIVALDLQAVLDRVITDGPFDSIDYAKQPVPSLRGEDAAWAIAQIANRGSENVE